MFESWTNEATEDQILTKFKIAPGELHGKLLLVDWLLYALHELALLSGYKEMLTQLRKLRVRSKYGVREELIPLVRLKGIGRIRSRRLFNNGLDSLDKLRKVSVERLSGVVGVKVANEIKKQLGENTNEEEREKPGEEEAAIEHSANGEKRESRPRHGHGSDEQNSRFTGNSLLVENDGHERQPQDIFQEPRERHKSGPEHIPRDVPHLDSPS